jgi:hypothetical protein
MESLRKSFAPTVSFKPLEEDGFQVGAGNVVTLFENGRPRHVVCTLTVSKKHFISVYLDASPETIRDRYADYRQVCDSAALSLK